MLYGIVVFFLLIALSDYLLNIVICIELKKMPISPPPPKTGF